ncbi:MAG: hypothetical protein CMH83_06355 [Nocardioides sp.]|nr:hypothetical protein [Nocardioides sp.]
MTTTTDTPVDTVVRVEDVRALLDGVWESFLGAEEPLLTAALPAHLGGWTAAVSVTGTWRAQITIEVVDPLARLVTAHMLGRDEEPAVEDVRDALGELVNMVGGNIKSLHHGTAMLSLPWVGYGEDAPPPLLRETCRLDLTWRGLPLRVLVHVSASAAAADERRHSG